MGDNRPASLVWTMVAIVFAFTMGLVVGWGTASPPEKEPPDEDQLDDEDRIDEDEREEPPQSVVMKKLALVIEGEAPGRARTGDDVEVRLLLTNTGTMPLADVWLAMNGGDGFSHESGTNPECRTQRLEPGGFLPFTATFKAREPGLYRILGYGRERVGWAAVGIQFPIEVRAQGEVGGTSRPELLTLSLDLEAPPRIVSGKSFRLRVSVRNGGSLDLQEIKLAMEIRHGAEAQEPSALLKQRPWLRVGQSTSLETSFVPLADAETVRIGAHVRDGRGWASTGVILEADVEAE